MASEADSQSIRIRASLIRQRLLARNGSAFFRQTLADISDVDFVRRDEEHHARKLRWVCEQRATTKHHGRI
jgi:hypothetical protein